MADWIKLSDENILNLERVARIRVDPDGTCRIYYGEAGGDKVITGTSLNTAETGTLMQIMESRMRNSDPKNRSVGDY